MCEEKEQECVSEESVSEDILNTIVNNRLGENSRFPRRKFSWFKNTGSVGWFFYKLEAAR